MTTGDTSRSAAFWQTAAREGFVNSEIAAERGSRAGATPPGAEAVAEGVLTATEVEIVEHLLDPTGLVPGYELLSHLGHGGMGAVYRARQMAFDRIVALKTVLVGPRADSRSLARFEQEAKSLGRLVHPHLVTAYDFSRHGGRLSLAMEYIAGVDAERWGREHHPAPERVVWGIVRQAASGLAYAASAGVIHRDIKPANLLLTNPPPGFPLEPGVPLVKIADFGLALLESAGDERTRLTMDNMAVGSPHFMAPEQLGGGRVDHRADIYGLGATAYCLLTGQRPFDGLSLIQILTHKLHEDPAPVGSLRDGLSPLTTRLLADLMQRDPAARIGDYAEFLARIDEVLRGMDAGGTVVSAGPTGESTLVGVGTHAVPLGATREFDTTPTNAPTWKPPPAISPPATPAPNGQGAWGRRRRWLVWTGAGLTLLAAVVASGTALNPWWTGFSGPARPGPRVWIATGWSRACYDGMSLRGWKTIDGRWIPGRDDGEGGKLLAGTDGTISFPLVNGEGSQRKPLAGYQVLALIATHEARAAELQFGLRATPNLDTAERGVVSLSAGRVVLGTRQGGRGEMERVIAERALPGDSDQFHEVRVERQPTDWYVLIDDTLLGTIPVGTERERPEFRLAATGTLERTDLATPSAEKPEGEAWFGDIVLDEIGPARPDVAR
jgi:serine/threonine protein kinase